MMPCESLQGAISPRDMAREQRIQAMADKLIAARESSERHELWISMRDEIAARSPAQVERMEIALGLRSGCVGWRR